MRRIEDERKEEEDDDEDESEDESEEEQEDSESPQKQVIASRRIVRATKTNARSSTVVN